MGKELCNKDGPVCRRYWLKAIKLTRTQSISKMFVSLVLQGKLYITPRAVSQHRGLHSTLTKTEQKTKQVFLTDHQINKPKSVFRMLFFFFFSLAN